MSYAATGQILTTAFQPSAQAPTATMPTCVTQAQHDAAVRDCAAQAIRGLGAIQLTAPLYTTTVSPVTQLHPCNAAKLPICPKQLTSVAPQRAPTPVYAAPPTIARKSSVAGGILLVVAVVAVGGGIVYYVKKRRR